MPVTFEQFPLSPALSRALVVLEYTTATPVQEHSLPPLLAGRDVIAQARTGSGKTAAFGLALLGKILVDRSRVQALVLCPTRELADQVSSHLRRLACFIPNLKLVTLCGGVPARNQLASLEIPPHVVVGTPGRVLDHLARGTVHFLDLQTLVLDEADRMLDMGFLDDITEVVKNTPKQRQTLLFSATYPPEIRKLSRTLQNDPVEITVDTEAKQVEIEQLFYSVEADKKVEALSALLLHHRPESALVFCQTRQDTRTVAEQLLRKGFSVLALHGELEQRHRDEILIRFANKSCRVLVATDVAARGLDIKELAAVISYELSPDPDVHLHRIGRTGRAGRSGLALSLCAQSEKGRAVAVAARQSFSLGWSPVPVVDLSQQPDSPPMVTLMIEGGKRDKLRPGDLLGALTKDIGLPAEVVGKITVTARRTYVAIRTDVAAQALQGLSRNNVKGKAFRVFELK